MRKRLLALEKSEEIELDLFNTYFLQLIKAGNLIGAREQILEKKHCPDQEEIDQGLVISFKRADIEFIIFLLELGANYQKLTPLFTEKNYQKCKELFIFFLGKLIQDIYEQKNTWLLEKLPAFAYSYSQAQNVKLALLLEDYCGSTVESDDEATPPGATHSKTTTLINGLKEIKIHLESGNYLSRNASQTGSPIYSPKEKQSRNENTDISSPKL